MTGVDERRELMRLFRENRAVNWHEHVWLGPDGRLDRDWLRELVAIAKAMHMDALVCSNPVMVPDSPPDLARRRNDAVAEAAALHPGFIIGMGFVNPGFHDEAIAEVDRCILELGFAGIKLYNQYFLSDPAVRGVIRRCAQLGAPILEHAGKLAHMPQSQPFISDGAHFAKAASENPDATFIYAHIGGGGDWEWSLKAIAPHGNVFADTSGGGCDEGMIERAVELLGAGRLLFGTDMSFEAGVGKLLAADISWEDKKTILCNPRFEKYLERGPRHAG